MTVGIALFLWSTGLPALFQFAEAASITNASDTLSNSGPSQSSVHTIAFTQPNGMTTGQIFVLEFASQFDLTSLVIGDISMTVGGNATNTAGAAAANTWGVVIGGDNSIAFETPTNIGVASSTEIVITIGDEAGTMIANPSATTSYAINIGQDTATTTAQDSGQVRVAIIDEVTVTASVDTTLEFVVNGVASGQTVNTSPTTTAAGTTNTTLPFGTLSADTSKTLAHDLQVTTNAYNGYTVSVTLSGPLQSGLGGVIDSFIDGADTAVPTAWTAPSELISDDKTWGHWGVTSDDFVTGRASEFSADAWAGLATSSPTIVMGNTGPADGTTAGVGAARIGYQVQTSPLQEAGTDYNTTLRYIATPTF
jgi:hypothetical protein